MPHNKSYQLMRLLWYFFIYFSSLSLHVSGFTSPSSVRRADARRQTTKHYTNQVVAHKQQLKIPLMMGW